MRWSIAPYFIVDDVVAAANFYRDKLGFQYERFWGGDPPGFTMVYRSGVTIMLGRPEHSGLMRPNNRAQDEPLWDAYVWIDDVEELYRQCKENGVKVAREIGDRLYGNRDFDIEDLNGYRLCFGQDIEGAPRESA
jgi:catechol 2,3-dioxygenase-like lactoylglutathione lyase family enzyme